LNSFGKQSILFVPEAGPAIAVCELLFSQPVTRLMLYCLSKEGMVPVPLTGIVQGNQKEARLLQLFEKVRAVLQAGNRVTKRPCQAGEHAGLHEEFLDRFGMGVQDLGYKILKEMAVSSRERVQKPFHVQPVFFSLERKRQ